MKPVPTIFALYALILLLSECTSYSKLEPRHPPRLSDEQDHALLVIKRSLAHRTVTFDSFKHRVGYEAYMPRKAGKPVHDLNTISMTSRFAPGFSERDLKGADVKELVYLRATVHQQEGYRTYSSWRVFVRDNRVIYMETFSPREATLREYYEVPW